MPGCLDSGGDKRYNVPYHGWGNAANAWRSANANAHPTVLSVSLPPISLDNRRQPCYTHGIMQNYEEVDGPGLRRIREARGLPRRVLAEKLGCSLGTVQNWEKGLTYPLPTFRKKLEEILHVRIKPRTQA